MEYTAEEVAKHTSRDDTWFIIHDKIYNVSDFLDDHPGGDDVLTDLAGKDATEDFDDVGHSSDAEKMMQPLLVGTLKGSKASSSAKGPSTKGKQSTSSSSAPSVTSGSLSPLLVLLVLVLALLYKTYN